MHISVLNVLPEDGRERPKHVASLFVYYKW